jgi:hypothetical protein
MRIALGAGRSAVIGLVVRQRMVLGGAEVIADLGTAAAISRLMTPATILKTGG